jgi:hypothetical protein
VFAERRRNFARTAVLQVLEVSYYDEDSTLRPDALAPLAGLRALASLKLEARWRKGSILGLTPVGA